MPMSSTVHALSARVSFFPNGVVASEEVTVGGGRKRGGGREREEALEEVMKKIGGTLKYRPLSLSPLSLYLNECIFLFIK